MNVKAFVKTEFLPQAGQVEIIPSFNSRVHLV